ncbi:metal-dependent hydrolase [Domibacillus tundrae]|uniref:metal-dependent hydrolase n=1 Tax=Domibacillus tundrae TaxID=1587527 RepID=UPI00061815B4|nr:metal-dependent hydrolase [Domibacillus tundrae]
MKGSSHMVIGAATGVGVAVWMQSPLIDTALFACTGAVAALVPDLDVNGKLANKITVEKKWLILFFAAAGLLLALYSYFMLFGVKQAAGFIVSVGLLLLPRLFIKQRMMLFLTGALVVYAGWYINEAWIMYIGFFILFASLVSHRTWTHSIVGIALFYFVAAEITRAYPSDGLLAVLLLSYISHLLADMKLLPANKKGTKFFYPVWKKEF